MTNEQRASLIKKVFFLVLVIAIVAGVWFYPKPGPEEAPPVLSSPENGLAIVLYHQPGEPASEQMRAILDKLQTKYGKQVIVSHVDVSTHPEASKSQGVTKPPHVIIISGKEKVFEFQGAWPHAKVEFKVEEILRGLKRVGKDWRPPVPGMTPAGS